MPTYGKPTPRPAWLKQLYARITKDWGKPCTRGTKDWCFDCSSCQARLALAILDNLYEVDYRKVSWPKSDIVNSKK